MEALIGKRGLRPSIKNTFEESKKLEQNNRNADMANVTKSDPTKFVLSSILSERILNLSTSVDRPTERDSFYKFITVLSVCRVKRAFCFLK